MLVVLIVEVLEALQSHSENLWNILGSFTSHMHIDTAQTPDLTANLQEQIKTNTVLKAVTVHTQAPEFLAPQATTFIHSTCLYTVEDIHYPEYREKPGSSTVSQLGHFLT